MSMRKHRFFYAINLWFSVSQLDSKDFCANFNTILAFRIKNSAFRVGNLKEKLTSGVKMLIDVIVENKVV